MVIRVPDLGEEDGRRLGEEVAQRLASSLPTDMQHMELYTLDVRLALSPGLSRDQMADSIAQQILRQLQII